MIHVHSQDGNVAERHHVVAECYEKHYAQRGAEREQYKSPIKGKFFKFFLQITYLPLSLAKESITNFYILYNKFKSCIIGKYDCINIQGGQNCGRKQLQRRSCYF